MDHGKGGAYPPPSPGAREKIAPLFPEGPHRQPGLFRPRQHRRGFPQKHPARFGQADRPGPALQSATPRSSSRSRI